MSTCSVPNCGLKVHRKGLCQKHYKPPRGTSGSKTGNLSSKTVSKPGAGTDDAIIKQMWANENKTPPALPPIDPKGQPQNTGQTPRQPGTPSMAGAPAIAIILKSIGNALAKATKIEEFKMDQDLADEISGYINQLMAARGLAMSPEIGLFIAILAWLAPGLIILFTRLAEEQKQKEEEKKRRLQMVNQPYQQPQPQTPMAVAIPVQGPPTQPPVTLAPTAIPPTTDSTKDQTVTYPKLPIPNQRPGVLG